MRDSQTLSPLRPHPLRRSSLLVIAAAMVLAACQPGGEATAVAERAQSAEVPPALPTVVDTGACWARDAVSAPDGGLEERLFAAPCPEVMDVQFWSSLQRALSVRGHYAGPVNGIAGESTRAAVRSFQAPMGLDSGTVSLDTARNLGLLPWPREQL